MTDGAEYRLWDAATGAPRSEGKLDCPMVDPDPSIRSIAVGEALLAHTRFGEGCLVHWSSGMGAILFDSEGPDWSHLFLSPSGHLLAGTLFAKGVDDPIIRVLDTSTGRVIRDLRGHRRAGAFANFQANVDATPCDESIRSVAFSSDESKAVTASEDGTIRVWDLRIYPPCSLWVRFRNSKGAFDANLIEKSSVTAAAFDPSAERVFTGSLGGTGQIRNARSGTLETRLDRYAGFLRGAAFTRDGARLLTNGWQALQLWNARTGGLVSEATGDRVRWDDMLLSEDRKLALTTVTDARDRHAWKDRLLWRTDSLGRVGVLAGGSENSAFAFRTRRAGVVVGANETRWPLDGGGPLTAPSPEPVGRRPCAFTPDGGLVAVAVGRQIRVTTVPEAAAVAHLEAGGEEVTLDQLLPDARRVIAVSSHSVVDIWDVETSERVCVVRGSSVAFTPDSRTMIVSDAAAPFKSPTQQAARTSSTSQMGSRLRETPMSRRMAGHLSRSEAWRRGFTRLRSARPFDGSARSSPIRWPRGGRRTVTSLASVRPASSGGDDKVVLGVRVGPGQKAMRRGHRSTSSRPKSGSRPNAGNWTAKRLTCSPVG